MNRVPKGRAPARRFIENNGTQRYTTICRRDVGKLSRPPDQFRDRAADDSMRMPCVKDTPGSVQYSLHLKARRLTNEALEVTSHTGSANTTMIPFRCARGADTSPEHLRTSPAENYAKMKCWEQRPSRGRSALREEGPALADLISLKNIYFYVISKFRSTVAGPDLRTTLGDPSWRGERNSASLL